MSSVRAGDHPISEAEVGGTSPGAIEDQELLLDEYGLSHDGTRAARPGEPDDGRHEVENRTARSRMANNKLAKSKKCKGLGNSPRTG